MIDNKSVLAVIPARGGSKGLPGKNIRLVGGKPMIAWSIEAAKKSRYIDRLVLSSEDTAIIEVATGYGCEVPFVRPLELAADDTPGIEPVLHALGSLPGYDYLVLLQPTSPLRTAEDIDGALETCVQRNATCCVSVSETEQNPYWMFKLDADATLQPLLSSWKTPQRRQDLPKVYVLNGAIYVATTSWLQTAKTFLAPGTVGYVMPRARAVDVDDEHDLSIVEAALAE